MRSVAYLMTHYPRHSQTFLIDEVLGVRDDELEIVPIAVNVPEPGDVTSPDEVAEQERTFYVKDQGGLRAVRIVASLLRRDPGAVLGTVAAALRAAGPDLRAMVRWGFYAVEAAIVWDRCERTGCRHLHAQFGTSTASVAMLAARLGSRLAAAPVTWSFTVHGYHEFTAEEAYRIGQKVDDAAFVVAVSDYTRSQLMRLSSPSAWPRIHRVHCGIRLDRFPFAPRRRARRPARVLTVGRLSPEKGQFVVLDAARILLDRGVDVRIVVVGDGPSGPELRARSRDLGVDGIVEFTGAVAPETVAALLADADVFCLPSFAEGIPVSVMEAFARGVPVVSTLVGGVPELVVDGESGRTVPAGRADLVADAIESLVEDDVLRARVQDAGRLAVEERHDRSRTTVQMRALLRQYA
jgi:glycosyltransferase involved in cell wall biosynthesis